MTVLLDHLAAVVAGVVLLVALLLFQTRDRHAATERAAEAQTRTRAEAVLATLAQDAENVLTPEQAADLIPGPLPTRLAQTDSVTTEATLATWVRDTPTGPERVGVVRYAAAATGDSAQVGGRLVPLFRLTRAVDAGVPVELSDTVADLGVAFERPAGPAVVSGPMPSGASRVVVRVAIAGTGVARADGAPREAVLARAQAQLRPQNLGPAR